MNSVALVGRLTKDPEDRATQSGMSVSRYTLAVDRRFKKEGEPTADFINCVAFGKTAEFAVKYFHKGMRVGITGRIQTGSYTDKDGKKVYTTDVVVDNQEFAEDKRKETEEHVVNTRPDYAGGFMDIPDDLDEELPFA